MLNYVVQCLWISLFIQNVKTKHTKFLKELNLRIESFKYPYLWTANKLYAAIWAVKTSSTTSEDKALYSANIKQNSLHKMLIIIHQFNVK